MEELLASLTTQEWAEWQVFNKIEPIGGARADYHAALVATIVSSTVPRKHSSERPKLSDYLVDWWKNRAPEQSADTMLRTAAMFTRAVGGHIGGAVEEAMASGDIDRQAGGDPRA